MSKTIRLQKDDVERLIDWLQYKTYDSIVLEESEPNGIGTTVTVFTYDDDDSSGQFKVITNVRNW